MRIVEDGGKVTVVLEGRADVTSVRRLWEQLCSLLSRSPAAIIIDMEAVTKVDGAMLQLLMSARRSATARGTGWHWRSVAPATAAATRLLGLEQGMGFNDGRSAGLLD